MAIILEKPKSPDDIESMVVLCQDNLELLPTTTLEEKCEWAYKNLWWYNAFRDDQPSGYVALAWTEIDGQPIPHIHFGLVDDGDVRTVTTGWKHLKNTVPPQYDILAYIGYNNSKIIRLAKILRFEKTETENLYIYKRR